MPNPNDMGLEKYYPTLFKPISLSDATAGDNDEDGLPSTIRKLLIDDTSDGRNSIEGFVQLIDENVKSAEAGVRETLHKIIQIFHDGPPIQGSEANQRFV